MELYSHSQGSPEVNEEFRRWLRDPKDELSKKQALLDLWENTPSDCDVKMPKAGTVYSVARKTERALAGRARRFGIIPWAVAAACAVLAVAAVYLFRPEPLTRLVSSSDSKGFFTLPDGSSVWLNMGSSLSYRGSLDGRIRAVTLEGEAFFDVVHDADRPFIVHSHDMEVTVTGTRFTVTSYPEQSGAIYLEEGSVTVKGDSFPETHLSPGQGIVFDDNTLSWKKVPILAKDHTGWVQDRLVFTNTALSDVFASMEHRYHISIVCSDKDFIDNTRITMTIRQETPDNIFESIALLTGMTYSREEGNRFIIRK